jgi:hypothetical protein
MNGHNDPRWLFLAERNIFGKLVRFQGKLCSGTKVQEAVKEF